MIAMLKLGSCWCFWQHRDKNKTLKTPRKSGMTWSLEKHWMNINKIPQVRFWCQICSLLLIRLINVSQSLKKSILILSYLWQWKRERLMHFSAALWLSGMPKKYTRWQHQSIIYKYTYSCICTFVTCSMNWIGSRFSVWALPFFQCWMVLHISPLPSLQHVRGGIWSMFFLSACVNRTSYVVIVWSCSHRKPARFAVLIWGVVCTNHLVHTSVK